MTPAPTGLWILGRPLPSTVVKSAMTGDNGKGAFPTFYVYTSYQDTSIFNTFEWTDLEIQTPIFRPYMVWKTG